uniref:FBD-associated F-box protein At5g56820 n=1 Tax=Nicotiana sylvestris TaxID=4096 RepID=A0A1U7VQ74_NICSY|nr:PREDICTED: putative FBD-associated F-box protein At5g56820 [Nicotiana sylvestris]
METSSTKPKLLGASITSTGEGIDRISYLPDEILHNILSSLYIFDVVQLSILSKRWNYICRTMPYLHFDVIRFGNERVELSFGGCHLGFCQLKLLHLLEVELSDEHLTSCLFSTCPLLEKLILGDCTFGTMTVLEIVVPLYLREIRPFHGATSTRSWRKHLNGVGTDEACMQAMVLLLKHSPNLEVLNLFSDENFGWDENWKLHDPSESIVCFSEVDCRSGHMAPEVC